MCKNIVIKLSHCVRLTNVSVLALTTHCPQLAEIDLTGCKLLTDAAIQAVFAKLSQVRDINLSHVTAITHLAFDSIDPSIINNRYEQLRILNLTACVHVTDDVLLRLIPAAPRLRSLALTKCDKITDVGVGVIKTLGKHLHYLHLGHCSKITDRVMISIGQHCTRIRYLDLACCVKLTDATLFALAQLPKLRRIGLVKCSNITDNGIYALLVTQVLSQTLERVHLSYCVNLTDVAVAALVNQCTKLTHLSLTGVPAFMSARYQTFCRSPPVEFTAYQRYVFCVFSGRGVRELRQSMQDHPSTVAGIPIPITSIRAVAASLLVTEQQISMNESQGHDDPQAGDEGDDNVDAGSDSGTDGGMGAYNNGYFNLSVHEAAVPAGPSHASNSMDSMNSHNNQQSDLAAPNNATFSPWHSLLALNEMDSLATGEVSHISNQLQQQRLGRQNESRQEWAEVEGGTTNISSAPLMLSAQEVTSMTQEYNGGNSDNRPGCSTAYANHYRSRLYNTQKYSLYRHQLRPIRESAGLDTISDLEGSGSSSNGGSSCGERSSGSGSGKGKGKGKGNSFSSSQEVHNVNRSCHEDEKGVDNRDRSCGIAGGVNSNDSSDSDICHDEEEEEEEAKEEEKRDNCMNGSQCRTALSDHCGE
ncbi:SCF ubiquitin ligase complex subunit [Podila epigama]|nr:SCF ubiquitin ligase complex subunit [Podila epigama]